MNKFEVLETTKQADKKQPQTLSRLYFQARELILNSSNYNFHQVDDLLANSDLDQVLAKRYILENFQRDEGALPGELEEVYLDLLFQESLSTERLAAGEDFYEIIKQINEELRQKNIIVNKELLTAKINQYKEQLQVA